MNVALFSIFSAVPPGGTDGPDTSDAFVNKWPHPIYVTDVVFDWDWVVPVRTAQTYGTPLGDAIRVNMTYRNQPITNGYLPVNLLARVENWPEHSGAIIIAGRTLHSTFIWKLPQPLWIPPNVPLSIRIGHQNDFAVNVAAAAQDVDVTVRGYLDESDEVPEWVDIPYATAFLGAVQTFTGGGKTGLNLVTERTAQTDLFNPFSVPLNAERLQYEISVSSHGFDLTNGANANFAPTDATSAQDQTSRLLNGQNYGLDRRYIAMRLTSSRGRSLIRDFSPIGAVISSTNRSLALKSILEPGHYYAASLQEQMPLFVDRQPLPFQVRTGISLVGSRRLTPAEAGVTYGR